MKARGGASPDLGQTITSSLRSGPFGVLTLWGIASSVVVPLTLYRQGYSFSVGYGFSVLAMGLALLSTFTPTQWHLALVSSVIFYGARLGSFLVIRNATVPSKAKKIKEFDTTPRLKRFPLAVSVALFYTFLVSPCMYALRSTQTSIVTKIGTGIAWFGAVLEAVADLHKFIVKRNKDESNQFQGPTSGVYQICRHPNYLGEIVYWVGLVTAGVASFEKNIVAWACSALGLYGIVSIMTKATERLDAQQLEKYQGQPEYDKYRDSVSAPLVPFVSG